jgi:hypothetical protein
VLGWRIDRNAAGEIIDLQAPPIRCGTPAIVLKEYMEEKRRRKALH